MPFELVSITTCVVAAVCAAAVAHEKRDEAHKALSLLAEMLANDPELPVDVVRDAFGNLPRAEPVLTAGHTHATAAANRNAALREAQEVTDNVGGTLYSCEMSKSDQRKGMKGSRKWRWCKDCNASNRDDAKGPTDVSWICDCDYYMNMMKLLADDPRPYLLYTVVPETATSNAEDDTAFYFDEDGVLHTTVCGGGSYQHHLWDYAKDSILAESHFYGILTKTVAYAVERRQIAKHRQLILLTPIKIWHGPAAWLASCLLEAKPLERFNPVVRSKDGEAFIRFEVQGPEGMMVTTAPAGARISATVPVEKDSAIAIANRLGSTKLQIPTAASWLEGDRTKAAVLTEYHRKVGPQPVPVVYPVAESVVKVQQDPARFDPEAKVKIAPFMAPFATGAYVNTLDDAAEETSIKGRIKVKTYSEVLPSEFVCKAKREFLRRVTKNATQLTPWDVDMVMEHLQTPAQMASFKKACVDGGARANFLSSFLKGETYMGNKDNRVITTFSDAQKLDLSCFTLALAEWLKQFEWYGPGKTPVEIATRVAKICKGAEKFVNTSDQKRMDAHMNRFGKSLMWELYLLMFRRWIGKLWELLKRSNGNYAKLPKGALYVMLFILASGSADTTLTQTINATFQAYLAFLHTAKPNGERYDFDEAFEALGIHFGDDGLDADLPLTSSNWASKQVGFVVEASMVPRGERGVNFLARYYSPFVWDGALDSMCDFKRQITKFHLTNGLPDSVKAEAKLVEKCRSFLATDGNTPVFGEFCRAVLVYARGRDAVPVLGVRSFWGKYDQEVQFPNENVDGWMDAEITVSLPEFCRATFSEWLASTDSLESCLKPHVCVGVSAPIPGATPYATSTDVVEPTAGPPASGTPDISEIVERLYTKKELDAIVEEALLESKKRANEMWETWSAQQSESGSFTSVSSRKSRGKKTGQQPPGKQQQAAKGKPGTEKKAQKPKGPPKKGPVKDGKTE